MKIVLKNRVFFLCFLPIFFFFSCSAPQPRFERVLGTICFVNLYDDGKARLYDEIFARLNQIDDEFNLGKPQSDLARINAGAFEASVLVGEDVFRVIETAQKISELTGGAFDISIEPLVSLWRVNTDSPHVATQSELDSLLPLVDFKNIVLNKEEKSVRFLKEGMAIDLGGMAKGFAADEIVKICKKHKIRRAVIDLGGNVYVYGKKSKSELWNVGVKNPEFPDSAPLLKLSLPEISVVTSGIYERFFDDGERRYHHILSPADGYPIENELASVTVICTSSMLADGLTTAFFVLGTEKSLAILPKISSEFGTELSAVFVGKNHTITFSTDFPYEEKILYDDWN